MCKYFSEVKLVINNQEASYRGTHAISISKGDWVQGEPQDNSSKVSYSKKLIAHSFAESEKGRR